VIYRLGCNSGDDCVWLKNVLTKRDQLSHSCKTNLRFCVGYEGHFHLQYLFPSYEEDVIISHVNNNGMTHHCSVASGNCLYGSAPSSGLHLVQLQ